MSTDAFERVDEVRLRRRAATASSGRKVNSMRRQRRKRTSGVPKRSSRTIRPLSVGAQTPRDDASSMADMVEKNFHLALAATNVTPEERAQMKLWDTPTKHEWLIALQSQQEGCSPADYAGLVHSGKITLLQLKDLRAKAAKRTFALSFIQCGGVFQLARYLMELDASDADDGEPDERLPTESLRLIHNMVDRANVPTNLLVGIPDLVRAVVTCAHHHSLRVRKWAYGTLSHLCATDEGHRSVLLCFDEAGGDKPLFSALVAQLQTVNDDYPSNYREQFVDNCMALVNALVSAPGAPPHRTHLRVQFKSVGLYDVFDTLAEIREASELSEDPDMDDVSSGKEPSFRRSDRVQAQMDVFQQAKEIDEEELDMVAAGVANDTASALADRICQALGPGAEPTFMDILRKLYMVALYGRTDESHWQYVEDIMFRTGRIVTPPESHRLHAAGSVPASPASGSPAADRGARRNSGTSADERLPQTAATAPATPVEPGSPKKTRRAWPISLRKKKDKGKDAKDAKEYHKEPVVDRPVTMHASVPTGDAAVQSVEAELVELRLQKMNVEMTLLRERAETLEAELSGAKVHYYHNLLSFKDRERVLQQQLKKAIHMYEEQLKAALSLKAVGGSMDAATYAKAKEDGEGGGGSDPGMGSPTIHMSSSTDSPLLRIKSLAVLDTKGGEETVPTTPLRIQSSDDILVKTVSSRRSITLSRKHVSRLDALIGTVKPPPLAPSLPPPTPPSAAPPALPLSSGSEEPLDEDGEDDEAEGAEAELCLYSPRGAGDAEALAKRKLRKERAEQRAAKLKADDSKLRKQCIARILPPKGGGGADGEGDSESSARWTEDDGDSTDDGASEDDGDSEDDDVVSEHVDESTGSSESAVQEI